MPRDVSKSAALRSFLRELFERSAGGLVQYPILADTGSETIVMCRRAQSRSGTSFRKPGLRSVVPWLLF